MSTPILISIMNDDVFEGVEYFQVRIVQTSNEFRVKIGQDRVNVTIKDDDSESFSYLTNDCFIHRAFHMFLHVL